MEEPINEWIKETMNESIEGHIYKRKKAGTGAWIRIAVKLRNCLIYV